VWRPAVIAQRRLSPALPVMSTIALAAGFLGGKRNGISSHLLLQRISAMMYLPLPVQTKKGFPSIPGGLKTYPKRTSPLNNMRAESLACDAEAMLRETGGGIFGIANLAAQTKLNQRGSSFAQRASCHLL
jgi:hypothetical protein